MKKRSRQLWVPEEFEKNIDITQIRIKEKFGVKKKKIEIVEMLNNSFDWESFENLSVDKDKKKKRGGNSLFGDLGGW